MNRHPFILTCRRGISLVEMMIVVAIITLLMTLLLPAINAAIEAARRNQCSNNLHQISLAAQMHVSLFDRFPTGGWDSRWVGDPDRGNDRAQPGGWIYNLLPYLEQQSVYDLGKGSKDVGQMRVQLQQTAIPLFNCRSRRSSGPFPNVKRTPIKNAPDALMHARSDYAANGGDFPWNASVDIDSYEKFATGEYNFNYPYDDPDLLSGISFRGSEIRPKDVTDGLSMCYMIGEKSLYYGDYKTGLNPSDDHSMFTGEDLDNIRWSREVAEDRPNLPQSDERALPDVRNYAFGSAHVGTFNMAFCDGSVIAVSYRIDPPVHQDLGSRHDGKVLDTSSLTKGPQ